MITRLQGNISFRIMMKHSILFSLSLMLGLAGLNAQGLHLSDYRMADQFFNPAHTASDMQAPARLGLFYRMQWAGIPAAYTTAGAVGEWQLRQFGLGFMMHQSQAGKASLQTTGMLLSGSYRKTLAPRQFLYIGFGIGHLQKSINPTLFTYDQQYVEGLGFDTQLYSGETFQSSHLNLVDAQIGLKWKGALDKKSRFRMQAGFAITRWHQPNESLLGEIAILPRRVHVHGNFEMNLNPSLAVIPDVFFQKQGPHREIMVGTMIKLALEGQNRLSFGGAVRLNDAVIGKVALDLGPMQLCWAYDATFSALKNATGGKGAWEMGMFYQFRRKEVKAVKKAKDRDGDGIADRLDPCPEEPGSMGGNGCPDTTAVDAAIPPDSDQDGVPDTLDKCPLEPGQPCFSGCNDADRDGVMDRDDSCPSLFGPPQNNGCPVQANDADKDGVPDDRDYCVFLKGDPEFHGCPDSDRDGISDVDDRCPYMKGTLKDNGCPEQASGREELPALTIEFETAQHLILPEFESSLITWAQHIQNNPYARIIIAGHTDAEGDAAFNHALGLRRAEAARDFLQRLGLPASRMEIISYGEAIPKASNGSSSGKALNRRVELVPIRE